MKETLEQAVKEHVFKNFGFDDHPGRIEREMAFKVGALWERKRVLELLRSDDAYQLNKHIFHYESKPKGWADWLEAKLSEMDKKEGDE